MSRNSRAILLGFLVLSSLLLATLIVGDWLPWLRGPAPDSPEWYWPYQLRPLIRWWPPIMAALMTWALATWWLWSSTSTRRRDLIALTGLVICSLILQLALIYADRPEVTSELVDRTLSNLASGFFESAAEIEDLSMALARYPQEMKGFVSEHARTHPPGLIAANWLTIQLFAHLPSVSEPIAQQIWPLRCTDLWLLNRPPQVAAALGFWSLLPVVAAALTCFPAFAVARLLLRGRAVRLATILVLTLPALLLFAPKSVQLYAPLTLVLFWVFHIGLHKRSIAWMFAAGVVLSLMTFLSLGNASLLVLFGLYALSFTFLLTAGQLKDSSKWMVLFKLLLSFSMGTAALWLVVWIGWGANPWAIAQTGLQQHYQLVTNFRRYDWWIIWNLVDLLLFAGWPLMLGFIGAVFLALRLWRNRTLQPVDILALSLLLLLILIDLSGSARGEVGRLWLFFMPLLAYPAARFWQRYLPGKGSAATIIALQLLLVVVIGLAWRPVRAVIVVVEQPEMHDAVPMEQVDGHFRDEPITLTGYTLSSNQLQAGDDLDLTLFWQANGPARRPYTTFNHLLDTQGVLVAQQDNWPVNGTWPPTCWRDTDVIVDPYLISLPQDLPAGEYGLITGLYDAQTGQRLPLANGLEALELTTIQIRAD